MMTEYDFRGGERGRYVGKASRSFFRAIGAAAGLASSLLGRLASASRPPGGPPYEDDRVTATFTMDDFKTETVTVRSGPHRVMRATGRFGNGTVVVGKELRAVYSVRRADGTPWLVPAEALGLPEYTALDADGLRAKLCEIIDPDNIPDWLCRKNEMFDGRTPLQVLDEDPESLRQMILQLRSGEPS